jgi:hypothetical protein
LDYRADALFHNTSTGLPIQIIKAIIFESYLPSIFIVIYRFDESVNYVELDYPRDISMFAGVGPNIDTVFQWKNGKYTNGLIILRKCAASSHRGHMQ